VAALPLNQQQHTIRPKEIQEVLKCHQSEANLRQEILWFTNYHREN